MARKRLIWKLREREIPLGEHTRIMAVLNVTPDSFYDGGLRMDADEALRHAQRMVEDGADIVDIGAESSRPGSEPLNADQELGRLAPILERLGEVKAPVSVDTYHAATARAAIQAGAAMINDISALRFDPDMAEVVAEAGCRCVLMHMQGTPQTMQDDPRYKDVVDDIMAFFEERLAFATSAGIEEDALWLDPGFGFGKTVEHNLEILRRLGEFRRFGRPVLIGTSNKGTIGKVLGLPVDDRLEGTAATVAIAVWNGADAVRVHDVKAMARVARMSDAVRGPCRDA